MTADRRGFWLRAPKLSSQQREEIRRRYQDGETAKSLAAEFGVTVDTVQTYGGRRS